jgi:Na+/H+ antiporter NhaC/CRP-like cAMP-binding protein
VGNDENIAFISMKAFFKLNDTPEDIAIAERLGGSLVRCEYAHGEAICRVGETASCMFFIESGKVEVLNKDDFPINEMEEGDFFGEYAVITASERLSTVCSNGGTIVYRMDKDDVFSGLNYNPTVYGNIIKQLYNQISHKHQQLRTVTSKRRGLIRSNQNQRKTSVTKLTVNYGIVSLIFLLALLLPPVEALSPIWYFLPILFLMFSIIITKRTMGSFVLACMLTMVMLYKEGFLLGFFDNTLKIISDKTIMEIVLLIALLGAVTRLLACSGAVNALRRLAVERIKTRRGSMFSSFLCMVFVFIDDHLSLEITGMSFMPVEDRKRVPREMSAFIMGMTPGAVNILVPFSIWGVYLAGILIVTVGDDGMGIFLRSIPYNFMAILTLIFVFAASIGILPLFGKMKKAYERVENGGRLWPPHSEQYLTEEENAPRGSLINLFLPLILIPIVSVVAGMVLQGAFYVHIGIGLLVTLIVMFVMYCFQRLMTPEEFFDNIIIGIEHSLVPIILLILTFCFSSGIKQIGVVEWLGYIVPAIIGGNYWLLPAVLFLTFTLITVVWGSSWSIYAIGLPIAIQLAAAVDGNMALYAGTICAAGIAGDSLSIHQSDNYDVAAVVGCEPNALFLARLPYFIFITVLSFGAYLITGIVLHG